MTNPPSFVFVVAALFLIITSSSSFSLIRPVSAAENTAAAAAASGSTSTACAGEDAHAGSCVNPETKSEDAVLADSIPSFKYDTTRGDDASTHQQHLLQEAEKSKDFAEYFISYAELHHQKDMLADTHRMESYYTAIMANAKVAFQDKVVLDVGTGSGILAVWAAKAGAKKVYAIEYTDMAHNARQLVKANNVEDIVTVIQGTVESITLPLLEDGLLLSTTNDEDGTTTTSERVVDVIISEWMGYMLLRESMLDSVLVARDRYLKQDTGLMFPSHAKVYLAPIKDERSRLENVREYGGAMDDWYGFIESIQQSYNVDYDILSDNFDQEQKDYYLYTSHWKELDAQTSYLWPPTTTTDSSSSSSSSSSNEHQPQPYTIIKELDLFTCTLQDTRGIFGVGDNGNGNRENNEFDFIINPNKVTGAISGFASWFTTDFKSRTDPIGKVAAPKLKMNPYVTLNTGPEQGYTHWGQQVFYFRDSVRILTDLKNAGRGKDKPPANAVKVHLKGTIEMQRTATNKRLYNVRITHHLEEIYNDSQKISRQTDTTDTVYKMI